MAGYQAGRFTRIILSLAAASFQVAWASAEQPNVVIVLTDDQGYGDLSCHGNPILKTPELDRLHAESVRFTDFHVSPFCTPTRAALMTGHHAGYTGAFRTSSGRTMMHRDVKTIGDLFSDAGYVTGMVGKWHLGDNAPHRPQDRGFQDAVWHRCGGIGQASDHWGNDYFDDTYERNGTFEKFEGYCTDVWFREGMRFITQNRSQPFLLYLATNAPHGPYRVPPEWAEPYAGNPEVPNPNFYGMIANLDHNMGLLREHLKTLGLAENTILIFMTDNGTAAGGKFQGLDSEPTQGFNAGMRGKKSSVYDGGHRFPFFVHWPAGGLTGGRDIDALAAHIDVLPTLADLCDVPLSDDFAPDGISLQPLLADPAPPWDREYLVEQFLGGPYARAFPPVASDYSVVMTERWRLVNSDGESLFDIQADPAQRNNIIEQHPEVVTRLRQHYDQYWSHVSPRLTPVRIDIGNPAENPTVLCSQDWYLPAGNPPWNFKSIQRLPKVTGPWMLNVHQSGRYELTLRQFPKEANKPVVAKRAMIEIAGQTMRKPVEEGSEGVVFQIELPAGPTQLITHLTDENGKTGGAYFTEVKAVDAEDAHETALQGKKTDFRGFDRYEVATGKGTISIVCPKKAAPGKPWLWRSIFWGMKANAVERFTATDLKLLEKGYHVVKAPGEVSGHPKGNSAIDAAYRLLTEDHGFSRTVSMASMSRETLALFQWASANPTKVDSIYVDNGVCNVKSWPAGKLIAGSGSIASGNRKSWEFLKQTYGFQSDEEALAAPVSPIDWLKPLADAKVPILMGFGTQDTAVPYEENGAILKERYEALGGDIHVILEDKGHHPHGLEDPTPVIDFVVKNTTPAIRDRTR